MMYGWVITEVIRIVIPMKTMEVMKMNFGISHGMKWLLLTCLLKLTYVFQTSNDKVICILILVF